MATYTMGEIYLVNGQRVELPASVGAMLGYQLAPPVATVAQRTASVRTPLAYSTSIMKSYDAPAPVAAPAPFADVPTGYPEPPAESSVSPALIAGGVLAALVLGFVAYKTLA
jgi:hypothetical protein